MSSSETSPSHRISNLEPSPLEYKTLSTEEVRRLYENNPELSHSVEEGCPTCEGRRSFVFKDEEIVCHCQDQLSRQKNYLNAGIGRTYQILDWDDYVGDPKALDVANLFLAKKEEFLSRGVGLILHGEFGLGKTLLAQLVLKELVMGGYSCFFTTLSDMIDMFTAGWRSDTERTWYQKKIRQTRVLVLDDVGREFSSKSELPESTFDSVLRGRAREGKSTILTMNLSLDELGQGYGGAVFSLLQENSVVHEFDREGEDFRRFARQRAIEEIQKGWTRPIF